MELAVSAAKAGATNHTLCIYSGTASIHTVVIPEDNAKWRASGSTGFRYTDSTT